MTEHQAQIVIDAISRATAAEKATADTLAALQAQLAALQASPPQVDTSAQIAALEPIISALNNLDPAPAPVAPVAPATP